MSNPSNNPIGNDNEEINPEAKPKERNISMWHLNHNLLCSLGFFLTGPKPGFHDILEFSILPVNHLLQFDKKIYPNRTMTLQPKNPENIGQDSYDHHRVPKGKVANAMLYGMDPHNAVIVMEKWFDSLKLPAYKKIIPLTYNWPQKREFLVDWLGRETFNYIFHPYEYRDTMSACSFLNDVADKKGNDVPYPDIAQQRISTYSKNEWLGYEALQTAVNNIFVYRSLVYVL